MGKQYSYHHTSGSRHGEMKCYVCGKDVDGEYRMHQTARSFVTAHRGCTTDDPEWLRRDGSAAANAEFHAKFVAACEAFRDRWDVSDLDHYITGATHD